MKAAMILALVLGTTAAFAADDLAKIKRGTRVGFSNGGWKYDRYKELESLDANSRITVADLKGPGVIRQLYVGEHFPKPLLSRGVVLEIYFDDAKEPAVVCPVADFFGDGCNGKASFFSSNLIEYAPKCYSCFIPMPFKKRARVFLRNDTPHDTLDYSFVEWETLPEWDDDLGYFHATFQRRLVKLDGHTNETFLDLHGTGHVIGRQFSIVTDDPKFRQFTFVMEGNNEIDIDGRERVIDNLGSECSFNFGWGWPSRFIGVRSGAPLVEYGAMNLLSTFRFHDHMPIRFEQSLQWKINWEFEPAGRPAKGNYGWVDYATVHYWYQDKPGGFKHEPLPPLAERGRMMWRDLGDLFAKMQTDPQPVNDFSSEKDMQRVRIIDPHDKTHPLWIDRPKAQGGHPGNPNPGKTGVLGVCPRDPTTPCLILRKVAIPTDKRSQLRIVTSGDPYENPGKSDFVFQAGIHRGEEVQWLKEQTIDAGAKPSAANWQTFEYDLSDHAGQTVGIVVKVSAGGPKSYWNNDEAFFDEISVLSQ